MTITEGLLLVRQIQKLYYTSLSPVCLDHALTPVELDILLFLSNNPDCNTARDIVELRGLAKSYVSQTVNLLMDKKLLEAREDPQDRRIFHLYITADAQPLLQQAKQVQNLFFSTLTDGIDPRDREAVHRVLRTVSTNLRRAL